jgi:hypothetical protein
MRTLRRRLILLAPALALTGLLLTPAPAGAIFGCGINPVCIVGKGIGGAVSSVASDAITALAKAVLGALGHAVEWASTLWVGIGTPPVADGGGQATGTVAFLQQNLLVFTTGLAVLCTLLGAGRIVYHEHKATQLRELGRYLVTYVLISGAAAAAASVLIGGSDQMASWFIGRASAGSDFADHLANLLGLATAGTSHAAGAAGFTVGLAGTVTTAFIAIVLGIIAFLATVIQIMLMLVRGGMLVLLVGTLPLVAAFSNTEMGMQWFRKASAWLVAFALYKPAAAIVYAVAFDLAGQPGALALLDGVMMLVLAILALPALLRFVVPATSALAGGGGAGGMLAGAAGGAIAMRMPTGAASVASTPASAYGQGRSGGPSGAALPGGGPAAAGMNGGGQSGSSGQTGQSGASGSTGTGAAASSAPASGAGAAGGAGTAGAGAASGGSGAAATDASGAGAAGGAAGAAVQTYGAGKSAASDAVESNNADGDGPTGASGNSS